MQFLNELVLRVITWAHNEREEGQTLVEYGLILALISVVVIAILTAVGGSVNTVFEKVNNALGTA